MFVCNVYVPLETGEQYVPQITCWVNEALRVKFDPFLFLIFMTFYIINATF